MRLIINGKPAPNTIKNRLIVFLMVLFAPIIVFLGIALLTGIPQAILIAWLFHINGFLAWILWWVFGLATGIIKVK